MASSGTAGRTSPLPGARRSGGPDRAVVRRSLPLVGSVSLRLDRRVGVLGVVVVVAAALIAAFTMTMGDFPIPLREVIAQTFGFGGEEGQAGFIVRQLRLPRTVAAIGVGAALGASGAIFQGLVDNPLVAPDIIGINAGASLAAVIAIVVLQSTAWLPLAAFGGAIGAAVVVYGLTWRGGVLGARLVLVGIGLNAILAALTTLVVVRFPVERVTPAVVWMTGTLYAADWREIITLLAGSAVLGAGALALMPSLRVVQLGDDAGRALGARMQLSRTGLLAVGSGLAGLAVSVAGPLAFVALISPHIARMLAGPLTGGVLLLAGGIGVVLVLVSDLIAQHAFSPLSLPVGVVTAAVGAPYFLWLLYRTNRSL